MKRPAGGAARGQKVVAPSPGELLRSFSGSKFTEKQEGTVNSLIGANWAGLPSASSYGEFDEIIDVMGSSQTMDYYKTDKARKQSKNLAGEAVAPDLSGQFGYYDSEGNPVDTAVWRSPNYGYDVDEETGELTIAGYKGPQFDEDESPAPLTVVPTSTTNPQRPRTVAAGYDKKNFKITVVFRDGTFYNYYEVSPTEWAAFKSRVSKGKYIYQYLDSKPRGPASTSGISAAGRKAFYRFTRAAQIHYEGKQGQYSKPKKP